MGSLDTLESKVAPLDPLHQTAAAVLPFILANMPLIFHPSEFHQTSCRKVTCCEVQASVSCPVIGIGAGGKVAGQAAVAWE